MQRVSGVRRDRSIACLLCACDGTYANNLQLAKRNDNLYAFVGYLYFNGLVAIYDVSRLPLSPPFVNPRPRCLSDI